MKTNRCFWLILILAPHTLMASEAPATMLKFNVTCPANKLIPSLDRAYHECNNGFADGSCDRFVDTFRQLMPEYDCQRPFDSAPDKNYIVPAIWLSGDGALDDYVGLLYRLAIPKGKLYAQSYFAAATAAAKSLFGSAKFRAILDGELAETYADRSRAVERAAKAGPR